MKKRLWIYDVETFPNFFGVIFIERDSDEKHEFIIYEDNDDLLELKSFILNQCHTLIGYNNGKFDDLIINKIMKLHDDISSENSTRIIYNLAQDIILSQKDGKSIYWNAELKPYLWSKHYKSVDLMSLMAFDKNRVSLKQAGIALKWHKIQDLPKNPDSDILWDEVDEIMKYCENDVLLTKCLYERVKDEIKIRYQIGQKYGLNLMSSSRSSMADKLMVKFWSHETGRDYYDFKDQRTKRNAINLGDCLSDKITFVSSEFQKLHESIKHTKWKKEDEFKHSIVFGRTRYDILLGGLHSNREPMIIEEDYEYLLLDIDFSSYYPMIMIKLGVYPEHLSNQFLVLFKRLVDQRLKAKKDGDMITADASKISINSIFGKLGFEHGWLFDHKAMYNVTLNGQLFLLMLVERLESAEIEVYYANTDGLSVRLLKSKLNEFHKIVNDFQEFIGIPIEFAEYKQCIIRDCNNYLIIKKDGKVKEKGAFVRGQNFLASNYACAYDMPVVAETLYAYFINGIKPEDFIPYHTDIYDFCKSQKIGGQFRAEFHTLKKDKLNIEVLQKTNRYYVSNKGGKLYKRKETGISDLVAGYNVTLFNDYFESNDYDINFRYYIKATNKIIDVLKPKQLKLF